MWQQCSSSHSKNQARRKYQCSMRQLCIILLLLHGVVTKFCTAAIHHCHCHTAPLPCITVVATLHHYCTAATLHCCYAPLSLHHCTTAIHHCHTAPLPCITVTATLHCCHPPLPLHHCYVPLPLPHCTKEIRPICFYVLSLCGHHCCFCAAAPSIWTPSCNRQGGWPHKNGC